MLIIALISFLILKQEDKNSKVEFVYEDLTSKSDFLKRIKTINDEFANDVIEYIYFEISNNLDLETIEDFSYEYKY